MPFKMDTESDSSFSPQTLIRKEGVSFALEQGHFSRQIDGQTICHDENDE